MNRLVKIILFTALITNEVIGSTYYDKQKISGIWPIYGTLHLLCKDGTSLKTRIKAGESISATEKELRQKKPGAFIKPYQIIIEND